MAFANSIVAGRDMTMRGAVENGITTARFEVQGVTGELRRAGNSAEPHLKIERLDLRRAPAVLAAAAAMLPANGELPLGRRRPALCGSQPGCGCRRR